MTMRLDVDDWTERLSIRGAKFKGDLAEAVTDISVSLASDQTTQLQFTVLDPGWDIYDKQLFNLQTPVDYGKSKFEITAVDMGPDPAGNEQVQVTCTTLNVMQLKRRTGKKVMRRCSPSEFVRHECRAVGIKHMVQDSSKRKQVSRDHGKSSESSGDDKPSTWTTFQRLASELGYICFEADDVLYFGKPSWLLKNHKVYIPAYWRVHSEKYWTTECPTFSKESGNKVRTVTVKLPRERAQYCKPGLILRLKGMSWANDDYLITNVDYSVVGTDDVSVSAQTPIDPKPQPPESHSSGGDKHVSISSKIKHLHYPGLNNEQLRNACIIIGVGKKMGFGSRDIQIGIATAMQESRIRNLNYGDRDSIGMFQQRSGWGSKKTRLSPFGSSRLFFQALRKVHNRKNMSRTAVAQAVQRSAFPNAYARWTSLSIKLYNLLSKYVKLTGGSGSQGSSKHPVHNAKRASDFVGFALSQKGDRYIFGAEVSLNDPDPKAHGHAFDCSELVQWAAARAGVYMPDGSSNQRSYCSSKGTSCSVSKAIRTRGALLFHPGHVAISLGNGHTIEAMGRAYGVLIGGTRGRFTSGGLVPKLRY